MIITKRFSDRKILSYDFEIMSVQIKKPKIMSFSTRFFFLKKKNKGLFLLSVQSYRLLLFWVFVMFSSRVGVVKNRSSYHVLMIQQS
jgi:hypothetical protein